MSNFIPFLWDISFGIFLENVCGSTAQCVLCKVQCHCIFYGPGIRYSDIFGAPGIRYSVIIKLPCSLGNNHEHFYNLTILKSESSFTNLLYCRPYSLFNFGNISWKQGKWKFFETISLLRSTRPQYMKQAIGKIWSACQKMT